MQFHWHYSAPQTDLRHPHSPLESLGTRLLLKYITKMSGYSPKMRSLQIGHPRNVYFWGGRTSEFCLWRRQKQNCNLTCANWGIEICAYVAVRVEASKRATHVIDKSYSSQSIMESVSPCWFRYFVTRLCKYLQAFGVIFLATIILPVPQIDDTFQMLFL